jgi:SAM-dependent methyltransferase
MRRRVLQDYEAPGWADVVADRPAAIAQEMVSFLGDHPADAPRADLPAEGVHQGITWKKQGMGPALLLLPFFLAPSQWQSAVARLAGHFTVITLGGPHLGGVAALEDRANSPTYRAMVRTLLDLMALQPGATLLDIGCGSGALDRLAAGWFPQAAITAVDSNSFLLSEAAALADSAGLERRIRFLQGNAEALPFPDASFDAVFSVTVLEECDADRAMAEMRRVLRPGGRMGVIVRSIDLPQWWSVPPPAGLAARMAQPPQSIGVKGVADASLYQRARRAGFDDLVCFPSLVTLDRPEGPIWRYREDHLLAQLSPEETGAWRAARDDMLSRGLLFMCHPMHCVVGRREARK